RAVYLSLVPLTAGVMLACRLSLEFNNMVGLMSALLSTLVFVTQNVFTKKILSSSKVKQQQSQDLHGHGGLANKESITTGAVDPVEQLGGSTAKLDKINILFYSSTMAAIFMIPMWLYTEGWTLIFEYDASIHHSDANGGLSVTWLLFTNGVSHFFQNIFAFSVLALTSPVTYSIASLIKRIVVIVASIVYFHQTLGMTQWTGVCLTFWGLWLYNSAKNAAKVDPSAGILKGTSMGKRVSKSFGRGLLDEDMPTILSIWGNPLQPHHLTRHHKEPLRHTPRLLHTKKEMSDQAELLRKRREARQKKILASGESRLSKITGTSGASAQVAPSPSVLHAREQLLKKEEEQQQRLRASSISTNNSTAASPAAPSSPTSSVFNHTTEASQADLKAATLTSARSPQGQAQDGITDEPSRSTISSEHSAGSIRMQRQPSYTSTTSTTTTTTNTASAHMAPTVQDHGDADPDDSLGAPPSYTPLSPFGQGYNSNNPFMANNPFMSAQHQQAMTRMMSEDGAGHSTSASSSSVAHNSGLGSGAPPPGFTVITPQEDLTAKWWKLLHFVFSLLLGLGVVYQEYRRSGDLDRFDSLATDKPLSFSASQVAAIPVFWYFITMELILQSTRMFLQGVTASPSSTLGTIAGFLPPPFSDAIRVFMRYRLIWSSLVSDLTVVVFIVGMTITLSHMFS
ncbi:suppressor of loss of ypt1, partial [Podila humilis]